MPKTFIIAEAACTWLHGGLEAAYRSIRAAKECGADAWKTQWTSDPVQMARSRGVEDETKYKRLAWPIERHHFLKAECDQVGIEYLCTVFLPEDVCKIHHHVKRAKIAAFESDDAELFTAWRGHGKPIIASVNPGKAKPRATNVLWCISDYPAKPESLDLGRLHYQDGLMPYDGLSDHTTSTLTGAVAVGAGARIIEKHVRLSDTPSSDPDYGHSLVLDLHINDTEQQLKRGFKQYVDNIREAERML